MHLHSSHAMPVQFFMLMIRWFSLGALLALSGACSPPTATPQASRHTAGAAQDPKSPQVHAWSRQLHHQLNDYRLDRGLPVLRYHAGLQKLCEDHCAWLRRKRGTSFSSGSNVSHSGSSYRARVARIQYGMRAWGENVAYVGNSPQDVATRLMVMWKASPTHNMAMLGNWSHAGNALVVDADGSIFATMNFGRKD